MSRTISIFKTLNSAGFTGTSASAFSYGSNSGGARVFEGYFVEHTLDAYGNAMSRYQAHGKIVGINVQGQSTDADHKIAVAVRQGSAPSAIGTLWDMSAGVITHPFGGPSAGGLGIRCVGVSEAEITRAGVVALPPNGISFQVNTDAQDSNHEDLYVFVQTNSATVGNCTVRLDIELDHGQGNIKAHKRARLKGTSSGAMH